MPLNLEAEEFKKTEINLSMWNLSFAETVSTKLLSCKILQAVFKILKSLGRFSPLSDCGWNPLWRYFIKSHRFSKFGHCKCLAVKSTDFYSLQLVAVELSCSRDVKNVAGSRLQNFLQENFLHSFTKCMDVDTDCRLQTRNILWKKNHLQKV